MRQRNQEPMTPMPHVNRSDRFRGSFLGMAVGDALGAPLEGLTSQQVRAFYGQVTGFVDGVRAWRRKSFRWKLTGLYTDDTQQALVLAESLIRFGRIDRDWIAQIYLELASPRGSYLGAHRGVGTRFRQVVEDLDRGIPPDASGQASPGIGAAMRIAPVGLYFLDRPGEILGAVLDASLMTHSDIRSLAAAYAVAAIVRHMALGAERKASLLFTLAHEVARAESEIAQTRHAKVTELCDHLHSISMAIARVESILDRSRHDAYALLVEEANRHGPHKDCRTPTKGFPPACIPACLYLLMVTESFEEALTEVVNLGGDADTAGAMLGAMAGACYGLSDIPARWLEGLRNRTGLQARADALAAPRDAALESMPDLVQTEQRLSALEAEQRDSLMAQGRSGGDLGANRRR
jgi:ADP-ribosylglycohydrolase